MPNKSMDKWLIVRVFLKMAERKLLNSNEFNRIMQIFFGEDKSESCFCFLDEGDIDSGNDTETIQNEHDLDNPQEEGNKSENVSEPRQNLRLTKKMFGWTRAVNGEYILNENEAYYYKMAINMASIGIDFKTIADGLFLMGARSKNNKKISTSEWKRLCLSEHSYGGAFVHKSEINPQIQKKMNLPKDEWSFLENALPPITDKKQWEEMNRMIGLFDNANYFKSCSNKKSPFHGKLICGKCGEKYLRFYAPKRIKKDDKDKKKINIAIWKCKNAFKGGTGCGNMKLNENELVKQFEVECSSTIGILFSSDEDLIDKCWKPIERISKENLLDKKYITWCEKLKQQKELKNFMFYKLKNRTITDSVYKEICADADREIDRLTYKIANYNAVKSAHMDGEKLAKIKEFLSIDLIKRYKNIAIAHLIDYITINENGYHKILFNKSVLRQTKVLEWGMNVIDGSWHMQYDSREKIRKINLQKENLLRLIAQDGGLSFREYAEKLKCSKNEVTARVRALIKQGYIKRDEDKKLVVIKE